ncbi:hypothetical protein HEP87_62175 [Streptomyces sp. S1D4-11]|nr:hypothetical protein [Streptomyces sp. S1D4-11]
MGHRPFERGPGSRVVGGHRQGGGGEEVEVRRDRGQALVTGGEGVRAGLVGAPGVHGGLHQVQQGAYGLLGAGREGARRGEAARVGVRPFEVPGREVRGGADGLGELGEVADAARSPFQETTPRPMHQPVASTSANSCSRSGGPGRA